MKEKSNAIADRLFK